MQLHEVAPGALEPLLEHPPRPVFALRWGEGARAWCQELAQAFDNRSERLKRALRRMQDRRFEPGEAACSGGSSPLAVRPVHIPSGRVAQRYIEPQGQRGARHRYLYTLFLWDLRGDPGH